MDLSLKIWTVIAGMSYSGIGKYKRADNDAIAWSQISPVLSRPPLPDVKREIYVCSSDIIYKHKLFRWIAIKNSKQ